MRRHNVLRSRAEMLERAIEVWPVRAGDDAAARSVLSADELARAARLRVERDRRLFATGRAALRRLLGAYLDTDPSAIAFRYTAAGKPFVDGPIRFSVSGSDNLSLLAFARHCELGVDVERIRPTPEWRAMAQLVSTPAEISELERRPEQDRAAAFLRMWTRKEAYCKAIGVGIGRLLERSRGGDVETAWKTVDLQVDSGYAATLVHNGRLRRIDVRPVSTYEEVARMYERV